MHTPFRFRVAVSPLSWTNDVLEDLGNDTPLEQCLSEAATAGFAGTELGRKFPREAQTLKPILNQHSLQLASGWHSGFLAERSVEEEMKAVAPHAELLQALGAKVMVYGECGVMVPEVPLDVPMSTRLTLTAADMSAYAERITRFARCLDEHYGLRLAYHHHLMMVAETLDEVSALFEQTGPEVGLLLDTGHAAAAGFDYRVLLERFGQRIVHIHLKDVRAEVMQTVREQDLSFNEGVRRGMFTVPGDGSVDFGALAAFVRDTGYAGWLVVEAEQDPMKAPPLETVSRARRFIAATFEAHAQA
ncbi:MAG TPA: myo-inosose-2 dehydratase [Telluria sp.]|nr:myo-inosose-2 dehydratase [Telluria sp.]